MASQQHSREEVPIGIGAAMLAAQPSYHAGIEVVPSRGRWFACSKPSFEEEGSRTAFLWMSFGNALFTLLHIHFPRRSIAEIPLLLCVISVLVVVFLQLGRKRKPVSAVDLEDGSGAVKVKVRIFQKDVLTGVDQGALLLEGDRLCFAGERMSFALTPADVDPVAKTAPWEVQGYPPLWLRHPSRTLGLSIEPLGFDSLRLCKKLGLFLASRSQSDVRGQLPPLAPAPWIWSDERNKIWRDCALWIGTVLLALASIKVCTLYDGSVDSFKYPSDGVLLMLGAGACFWLIRRRAFFAGLQAESRSSGESNAP